MERSRTTSFSQADERRSCVLAPFFTRQGAWVIPPPDTALYILDPPEAPRFPWTTSPAVVKRPERASWAGDWTRRIGALFHETRVLRDGSLAVRAERRSRELLPPPRRS